MPSFFFVNGGQSIQNVINGASAGDTIMVGTGVFTEDLTINKSLNIISLDGAGTTFIDGTVNITASNVDFGDSDHGFTIQPTASETAALSLGAVSNVHIEGNTLVGNATAAASLATQDLIASGGDGNINIENNVFSGTADELLRVNGEVSGAPQSHDILLTGNHFTGTVTSGGTNVILDADTSTVTGNTFGGDGAAGLVLKQGGDTVASSNDFTAFGAGTDIVTVGSFDLSTVPTAANLTLADAASNLQTFDDMALGPITDGENGWKFVGSGKDQQVVSISGNHEFRMSSDPSVADFSGPFSPELAVAAGEPETGALASSQSISFDFSAVNPIPDGSRLEIDFGNADGTDRNNFLAIESFGSTGIRIAVSEPDLSGNFSGDNSSPAPNDWRELISHVDPTQTHHLEMRLDYVDGADNDVIQIYLDGNLIGTTTTFENYHDALGGTHLANAEANLTDRVFFRGSANGAPQDGPGGAADAGFNIDNVSTATYNNTDGSGNVLDNIITGNTGDNTLSGAGGNDTLNGGGGNDNLVGGAGNDALDGGPGFDVANYSGNAAAYTVAFNGTTATVTDTRGGSPEGTDTVTNVGTLHFADHNVLLVGPGSDFKTIQAAVNAAHDGDTILVGPGHYQEQVTVDGLDITIKGAGQDQTFIDAPPSASLVANVHDSASSRPDKFALVGATNDAHLTLEGLTIDGLNHGTISDPAYDFAGIEGVNASVDADHVTVTGIQELDNVHPTEPSGVQHNSAVIIDNIDGDDRSFTMSNSIVENFQKNGFVLAGEGLTVDVNHNTVTGAGAITTTAQNGIELFGGATGSITDNTVSGIDYTPATVVATSILVFDAPGVIVSGNAITGATGDGDAGIYLIDSDAAVANNNTLTDLAYGLIDDGTFTTPLSHTGNIFNPSDLSAVNVGFYPDTTSTTPYTFSGGDKADDLEGAAAADHLNGLAGNDYIEGFSGNDVLAGGTGNDTLVGDAGTDTATYGVALTAASFTFDAANDRWVVDAGTEGTDTLTGIEVVTDSAGHTFRLVDAAGNAGYAHIQDAVDAASAGDFILVAPGTYSESKTPTPISGTPGGLYIDTPNLTLLGYSANDGSLITAAADAKAYGPTVISAHETDFGSNHFVGPDGSGVTIEGLHLQAGPETDNKLLEIWADNVTVENSFIDVNEGGTTYTGAIAVYFNGDGTTPGDISAFKIDHNILNEGIDDSNGIGDPPGVAASELITNNLFEGTFDNGTGLGRYDTIVLNGQVPGIGWLLAPNDIPTISGNTVANNTTPFLLRGSDQDPANLPTAAEIATILAANGDGDTTYAYVLDGSGDLRLADRNDGSGPYHSFAVTNTLDTLNLALDITPDQVFGGQRNYLQTGDTVVIQSGDAGPVNSSVMVDNLTIKAMQHSADLNLTLATEFADGSSIADGGVKQVTLADYASGLGANVDVTGNGLDNVITGDSGNNSLRGLAGNDTLKGGGGNDFLDGGADTDTVVYPGPRASYQVDDIGGGQIRIIDLRSGSPDGTDTVQNVETFTFSDGTFTAATVLNDPPTGGVTITGAATENVVLSANTTTLGDADGLGALHYQWQRGTGSGFTNVGTDQSTYALDDPDVGGSIRVKVSYTDGHGTAESLTSGSIGPVVNVNDAPTGSVTINGAATENVLLSANTATLGDADGLGALHYQWQRDTGSGFANVGADQSTYALDDPDVGGSIRVKVSYTDGHGTAESLTSGSIGPVANVNDAPTGSVTLSGAPTEDQTLTASNTLADADGLGAIGYQWQRNGVDVAGATASSYLLGDADVAANMRVVASYTDGHGTHESVASAATSAIVNINDPPTGVVTIGGTPTEDQTLTVSNTLADADGLGAIAYQWERDGVDVAGATAPSYLLGDADVGTHISVVASYTDGHGTHETVASAATTTIVNVDDAPVAQDGAVAGSRNSEIPGTVTATDVDNTPAQISYNLSGANGGALHGAVSLGTDGHFTYTPAFNYSGPDVFHFVASDGTLSSNVGTVSVVVNASGGAIPPDAVNDTGSANEYQTVTGNVIAGVPGGGHDTDPAGSTLTVTGISGGVIDSADTGAFGTLLIHGDGSYSYAADHAESLYAGTSGTDTFTYTLSNGVGVDTATLTVTVNGVNTGTDGDDHVIGGPNGEGLDGGAGNDVMSGNGGDDSITGGTGDDTISGGDGNDSIGGNDGNDTITGDAGNDTIGGDNGNDHLDGGAGNDVLFGGSGDDELHGGTGDDIIVGMDGNDAILGEDGNDIANGGAGNDVMIGGAGDDILGGGADNDTITGDDGNDQLWGEDGNDIINGGTGNDGVSGGAGDDQLGGGAGDDIVVGDDGNDVLFGEAGNDKMNGGAGNDIILGGDGDDQLGGGSGDDQILGGNGNDVLWGEDGNDTLNSGTGDDLLIGGAGSDTFAFTAGDGNDTILDFAPGQDHVWFTGTSLHSFADVQAHASVSATGATVISYNGGTVTLNGVAPAALHAGDFIFS